MINASIMIIDMDIGNIKSVEEAFKRIGANPRIASQPYELEQADVIILPGVGAFSDGISNLHKKGLVDPIKEHVFTKKKPILGICLGMQLMSDESEEHGLHKGLGLIKGRVVRLKPVTEGYRVPNIGWCDVKIVKKETLFSSVNNNESFYFAHSYYLDVSDSGDISGTIVYSGREITAAVESKNIYGVQFHPEKSQDAGLDILESFVRRV